MDVVNAMNAVVLETETVSCESGMEVIHPIFYPISVIALMIA